MKKLLISFIIFWPLMHLSLNQYKYVVYEKEVIRTKEPCIKDGNMVLIQAIIFKESSNRRLAYNKSEDAVSFFQQRRIFVDDVNRILKFKLKSPLRFSYQDRWDSLKGVQMFLIYHNYYTPDWNHEKVIRKHNGGPDGHLQKSTLGYLASVEKIYDSIYKTY